jgi:hypothetical protein
MPRLPKYRDWMTAAPNTLPELARPAPSRGPAVTGAEPGVLNVVASADSPFAQDLFAGDLGVPVGDALLACP